MNTQILSTTNYSIFGMVASNRDVNNAHVKKIKAAIEIKNLLHINPITVNTNMQVLDGQHRLVAAEELKTPIYYIVADNVNKEDISRLNTNKLNWKTGDFLNFWTVEGNEDYKAVSKFMNNNPQVPITGALKMISPDYPNMMEDFREGRFKVKSIEDAEKIAAQLKDLAGIALNSKFIYSSIFIGIFSELYANEQFDYKRFVYKIEQAPKQFVACIDRKQYFQMINEVYNRNARDKSEILFK